MKLWHGCEGRLGSARWTAGTAALAALLASGCATPERVPSMATWVVGQSMPAFDPQGPPDAARWAIERLLSRGLVEEDSTGHVVPAAAESIDVAPDGLTYTFHLRPDLRFANGTPCGSDAFRRVLETGANRLDHATYAWVLAALTGMDRVRAGRPLPPLGIATPDQRTLVLKLSRPDPTLLQKLALPGASTPWRSGGEGWHDGIGSYAIATSAPGGLTLGRRGPGAGVDTLKIRFVPSAARVRALLRLGAPDLVWPLPPDLLDQPLPAEYQSRSRDARPERRLLLVLRADLPPTTKAPARHALAYAVNRGELIAALGKSGEELDAWLPGAPTFDFPRHDPEAVRDWMERGDLGRSLHVVMSYSAEGSGMRIARSMQSEWAGLGLDVELRPLKPAAATAEALRRGGSQLLLVEARGLLDSPAAELATVAQPLRGPAVGAFATGWSTREFDRWIAGAPGAPPLDPANVQQRLAEEHVVLPLARLPWLWVQRGGAPLEAHPGYGPWAPAAARAPEPAGR